MNNSELKSITQVVAEIGGGISTQLIYKWQKKGLFEVEEVGGHYFYSPAAVERIKKIRELTKKYNWTFIAKQGLLDK